MTIRYKCHECGSAMKIKDELAGTKGKCPKCKTRFVVPELESDEEAESADVTEEEVAGAVPDEPVASTPTDAAADDEYEDDEYEDEEWEDDDEYDEDEAADLPMEMTPAPDLPPEPTPQPEAPRPQKPAGRKAPGKKATRIKSAGDSFDPTDVLFEDDGPPARSAAAAPGSDNDDDPQPGAAAAGGSSMADLFKDFTPAGERKTAGTAANVAASAISTSGSAAELLARTAEDKKSKGPEPTEPDGPGFSETAGDLIRQFGPWAAGVLGLCVVLWFGMSYMVGGGNREVPDDLVYVSGVVKKDGKPVKDAMIMFTPSGDRDVSGSNGISDEDGEYELIYTRGYEGAVPGTHSVFVTINGIPQPPRDVVVKPNQSNTFNFNF